MTNSELKDGHGAGFEVYRQSLASVIDSIFEPMNVDAGNRNLVFTVGLLQISTGGRVESLGGERQWTVCSVQYNSKLEFDPQRQPPVLLLLEEACHHFRSL